MLQFNSLANEQPDLPLIKLASADYGEAEWNNFTPSATLTQGRPHAYGLQLGYEF